MAKAQRPVHRRNQTHQQHAWLLRERNPMACRQAGFICRCFWAYADQRRDSGGDTTMSCYVQSNPREMAMTHQTQDQESIVMINSVTTRSTASNTTQYHIASTSEGCWISRDKEIRFVVSCGKDSRGARHVPTLPAAYALCQQLMPRRHSPLSQA